MHWFSQGSLETNVLVTGSLGKSMRAHKKRQHKLQLEDHEACSLTLRHFLLGFTEVIRVIGLPIRGIGPPPEITVAVKKLTRLQGAPFWGSDHMHTRTMHNQQETSESLRPDQTTVFPERHSPGPATQCSGSLIAA